MALISNGKVATRGEVVKRLALEDIVQVQEDTKRDQSRLEFLYAYADCGMQYPWLGPGFPI
jgi:hypothetical protein